VDRPPGAIPHDRRRLCALAALPFAKGQIDCLTKGRIGSQPRASRKAIYRCSGPNFLAQIVGERARTLPAAIVILGTLYWVFSTVLFDGI
jgi:hypothetical protein